jgi:flagellar biosynthesis/type III secretory pathway protein FliH
LRTSACHLIAAKCCLCFYCFRIAKQGFQEGVIAGKVAGYEKGFVLGNKNGSTVNRELGCYSGFSLMWLMLLSNWSDTYSSYLNVSTANKARIVLQTLTEMINHFPRDDPHNETLQHQLANIRAKFKQVCSLLNVNPTFDVDATAGISF